MKKKLLYVINTLILSLFIFNNLQIITYSSIKTDVPPDILNIVDEIKKISSEFNTNLTKAFNYKLVNENPTIPLTDIDAKIKNLDNLREVTIKNIENSNITPNDKQSYLLLSIILGYYKLSYEELKNYLTTTNIEENYKSLYTIYTYLYQANILTRSLESELNLPA